ncbi:hypothetical protein [Picosynechococcus sp. PCC 7117]|uniref:hypothetical protein n=1 Tax=Picosynechococcus sp. PCC 7117 TaxID=195498 RepID=UPI00081086CE|nr:hypothetical protein [Picosynechococcus sp. PCC 7117]ANV88927.1 hypothetical protein AWQ22_15065 [Picosynechococcus sp. PCC 7117]
MDIDNQLNFQVYAHNELLQSGYYREHRSKIDWIFRQFILSGNTTKIKSTVSLEYPWFRTELRGCKYYLWWITGKYIINESEALDSSSAKFVKKFYCRIVRHHDHLAELDPGKSSDYQFQKLAELDPCFDEQNDVINEIKFDAFRQHQYKLDAIKGDPGSGKTVALECAASQLAFICEKNISQILYITYTEGLKNKANLFFQKSDVSEKVKAYTFNEFIGYYNQVNRYSLKKFEEALKRYSNSPLGRQELKKRKFGNWKLEILWIEIRAYIYGLCLPFSWMRGDIEVPGRNEPFLDFESYSKIRQETSIDYYDLEIAHKIASYLFREKEFSRVFPDLFKARENLNKI